MSLISRYTEWQEKTEYAAGVEHLKNNEDFDKERIKAMERARSRQQVNLGNDYFFVLVKNVLMFIFLNGY